MKSGDLYLANFPFGGSVGMKLRPVLLLTGPIGPVPEVVAVYISSIIPTSLLPSDILLDPRLPEFTSTGLKSPSLLRLHKVATLHARSFVRRLGQISPATNADIALRLHVLLNI